MPSYIFKSQLSTILSTVFVDRNSSYSRYKKMQAKKCSLMNIFNGGNALKVIKNYCYCRVFMLSNRAIA